MSCYLVLGNTDTYPGDSEVYELFTRGTNAQVVGLKYTDAVENPESYVLAAVGYNYALANGVNAANQRVEFYSGYTTQG